MADHIIAKNEGGNRTPAPEGQFLAVCCDIIDLGIVETTYQGKVKKQHRCVIAFQLDEINPETGKRWELFERFTVSMWDKANLRKFLGTWRGRPYSDEEADEGAPLHKLEGVSALVQVEHRDSNGKTYANIGAIMKAPKGTTMAVEGYERAAFWKKSDDRPAVPDDQFPPPLDDEDDLPFRSGDFAMSGEFFAATSPTTTRNAIREGH